MAQHPTQKGNRTEQLHPHRQGSTKRAREGKDACRPEKRREQKGERGGADKELKPIIAVGAKALLEPLRVARVDESCLEIAFDPAGALHHPRFDGDGRFLKRQ